MLSLDFSNTNIHMRLKIVLFPVPIYTAYSSFFFQTTFRRLFLYIPTILSFYASFTATFLLFRTDDLILCAFTIYFCVLHQSTFYLFLFGSSIRRFLFIALFLSLSLSACVTFAFCSFQKSIDCSFWQGILFECIAAVNFRYSFGFVVIVPNFDRQSESLCWHSKLAKMNQTTFSAGCVCVYAVKLIEKWSWQT